MPKLIIGPKNQLGHMPKLLDACRFIEWDATRSDIAHVAFSPGRTQRPLGSFDDHHRANHPMTKTGLRVVRVGAGSFWGHIEL
jgi:hypothetical protein